MSNATNEKLLLEAQELIEYWEGTAHADLMRCDIKMNDLEALQAHADEARHQMLSREYQPEELHERAESLRDAMREDGLVGQNDTY